VRLFLFRQEAITWFLLIKMQDCQIPFKGGGELFREISQRIRDALARTEAGDNDEAVDVFVLQGGGFNLIGERFKTALAILIMQIIRHVDDHALKAQVMTMIKQRGFQQPGGLIMQQGLPPMSWNKFRQYNSGLLAVIMFLVGLIEKIQ
jgi:hypothetical protein